MIEMKCPKCGADCSENAIICEYCRFNLKLKSSEKNLKNTNSIPKNNNKRFLGIIIVIIVFIIVSLIISNLPKNIDNNKGLKSMQEEPQEEKIQKEDLNADFFYDENGPFMMSIETVTKSSNQSVIAGKVQRGSVKINDYVDIIGLSNDVKGLLVKKITIDNNAVEVAHVGDQVEIAINSEKVQKGQVLAEPNSLSAYSHIIIEMNLLTPEEGGLKGAIYNQYRPQFTIGGPVTTGVITLLENKSMAYPGDKQVQMDIELVDEIALEEGLNIHIMSGEKVIAVGKVIQCLE